MKERCGIPNRVTQFLSPERRTRADQQVFQSRIGAPGAEQARISYKLCIGAKIG